MGDLLIRRASERSEEDLSFIGEALVGSERGHLEKGVWDLILPRIPIEDRERVMAEVSRCDPSTHFHISRFYLAEDTATGAITGAACVFPYPELSITTSFPGILRVEQKIAGLSDDEVQEIAEDMTFYGEGFPDLDYDGSYMIESIYTSPAYRGRRVAQRLINHIVDEHCPNDPLGYRKIFIACAVGNESAYRAYQRAGFVDQGRGENPEAMRRMGLAGFHMLRKDI